MRRRTFLHSCIGITAGIKANIFPRSGHSYSSHIPAKFEAKRNSVVARVMGTAQDGGIPHIGCLCSNCQRAWTDTRFSRFISSLALFDFSENITILVDATPDIRAQTRIVQKRLDQKRTDKKFCPDAILLTHAHIGHYSGLMFYGYEAQSTDRLPIYCSKQMNDFLVKNAPWSQLVEKKNIVANIIVPEKIFSFSSQISVEALQVPHRDEFTDTLGFKIKGPNKSLLYIPDIQNWKVWDRSIAEEVGKVDIALLDGTFFSPQELPSRDLQAIGHPFISDSMHLLGDIARQGKILIYFTHLNHSNLALEPHGDARKTMRNAAFDLAQDGMEFSL